MPVLAAEVCQLLQPQLGQTLVDCTVGLGGHTRLLAEAVGATGRIIGLDQDAHMLAFARQQLDGLPVMLVQANFDQLRAVLQQEQWGPVDGVLADLGFCSAQMEDAARGFSFQLDGPLDMRLNPDVGEPAGSLLRRLPERELADLIYQYGEERFSRRIARKLVEVRQRTPLQTTAQLAELVRRCVPRGRRPGLDPATRTFQALRIAVNDELGALERLLATLPNCVKPGGRVVLLSFHSLEDRLVKRAFRDDPRWEVLTRKPVEATEAEVRNNPRARSAKLRAARRVEPERLKPA